LFEEAKRRTNVVGVFPNEVSAATLATEISLGSSEQWTLKRYLTMDALEAVRRSNPQNFETSTCKVALAHGNP
jgi:putative transposase